MMSLLGGSMLRSFSFSLTLWDQTHTCTHVISSSTCSEDPFQAVWSPGCGSSRLSWGASVGCGGRRVGLWREVWRRIASLYQHLSRTQQTHTVLAWQEDGLLHHLVTHRAMQLPFHALHVGLEGRGEDQLNEE